MTPSEQAEVVAGNLDFIAALRNAAPALMDAAERCARLEAALRRTADFLESSCDVIDDEVMDADCDGELTEAREVVSEARAALSEGDSK